MLAAASGLVARKRKSRVTPFRLDEEDRVRLNALAQQTSCSRTGVLRCCADVRQSTHLGLPSDPIELARVQPVGTQPLRPRGSDAKSCAAVARRPE